jgi:hypothetical protein
MTFELFQEVRSLQNAVRELYDVRPRTRAGLMCTPRGISHVCLHDAPHYPSSNRVAQGFLWIGVEPRFCSGLRCTRLVIVGFIKESDELAFGMGLATQERTRLYINCILHSGIRAIQHVENLYNEFCMNQKSYLTIVSPRKTSPTRKEACEARSVIKYPHNPQKILH